MRFPFNLFLATSLSVLGLVAQTISAEEEQRVSFESHADRLVISIDGRPFAEYVFADKEVLHPYLARVHALGGQQVTRNQPPIADRDAVDHPTMHPGIWLSFGDLSGVDFWRNKGVVVHQTFVEQPAANGNGGAFVAHNEYRDREKIIATETCRLRFTACAEGYLIDWDSTFNSDTPIAFGDQEEMGLGIRMATPLTVKNGGQIVNSEGALDEKQVWGKQSDWCDYRGMIDGQPCGILIMPHPKNFRRSWFHARDYGVLVANPFGQKAFTGKDESRVVVEPGQPFRLRFGLLVHGGEFDPAKAYKDWVTEAE